MIIHFALYEGWATPLERQICSKSDFSCFDEEVDGLPIRVEGADSIRMACSF